MKSYKHIFEKINNKAAVYMAMHDALAGRKKQRRQDAQRALKNVDKFSDSILEDLKNYKNKPHTPKEIYDGISRKKRTIIVPSFRNKVILRKSILFKMCRKARRIGNKIKLTIFDLRQMMSYIGWLKSS